MKLSNQKILITIVAITLILLPVIAFTTGPLRIALGIMFIIFFPGYTLLSTIFPKQTDLGNVERLALSLGLSIAIVALIGLVLNYTPWGIELYPIYISITIFIAVTSAVCWYRQRKLPEANRLSVTIKAGLPNWTGMSKLDKGLSISLAVAIVAALACLGYVVATPKQSKKFTEFYILSIEGKAENYPSEVALGKPVNMIIGVINNEYEPASYYVVITIDGLENSQVYIDTLAHEEKWEESVSFVPQVARENSKVEFHLYKNGDTEPYFKDPLQLSIDVY
jgi:uncharacterized membrane protein